MNKSRRKAIVYVSASPLFGLSGCGGSDSNSGDSEQPAGADASGQIECDSITSFTTASQVDQCGSLINTDSPLAQALQWELPSTRQGQRCGNCRHYQGSTASIAAPCPLFPGSLTDSRAWCSAYTPVT